ncbi:acyl-CoA dehydrogenase family protein [Pelagibacterium lacus]|uniref:Acyl-CoA dehydrogenase n=1 Tax=Pelagibacterium lacus TaxID=2282655 RepID=A0A369W4F0_9HYPH|nr:acyl-CoA dehydrogenase family protein [Pelagibacterium lacus]RDE09574.1 acyl-CoA dehydrogenase [Pelagibacterium lacus]
MTVQTDWNGLAEAEFRAILRAFIAEKCPANLRYYPYRFPAATTKVWYEALHEAGMIAPGWPVEYGGMGLTPARHLVFIEEMEAGGTPFLHDSGVRNLGPALIAWGTEAQKQHYLPAMHSGAHIWCQGYSEPSAGSDLASLSCSGRFEGDRLIINGQKIWTTSATEANHMFALVRTDTSGPKQEGITFVLVDMSLPGLTVRPIDNLSGHSDFCEVFFDDVSVGADAVVSAPNEGWKVARAQLGFERIWAGSPKRAVKTLAQVRRLMAARGLLEAPGWGERLAQATFDTLDAQDLYARFADLVGTGGTLGVEVSALKIWSTATFQSLSEMLIDAAEDEGGIAGDLDADGQPLDVLAPYYESRAPAIFAGTNEIHRNILARSVLGLPKSG